MNFLNGGLLGALALAALPLIIHLINRRRAVEHRFAAFDFVMRSRTDTFRRFRLRSFLLLLVRTLIVLLFVAAAAMPVLYRGEAKKRAPGGAEGGLIVVVDNSASMASCPDSMSDLSAGRRFLEKYLEQEDAGVARIIPLIGEEKEIVRDPGTGAWPEGAAAVSQSWASGDMAAAIRRAGRLAAEGGKWDRLLIISDFAQSGWAGVPDTVLKGASLRVVLARTGPDSGMANAGITALSVKAEREGGGPSVCRLQAEVLNGRPAPLENAPLSLFLNNKDLINGFLSAAPGRGAIKEFVLDNATPASPGWVRMEPDSFPWDDIRYFVFSPPLPVKSLLVDGDQGAHITASETYFLERALSGDQGGGSVAVVPPENFSPAGLKDKKALFLCNHVPSTPQMEAIASFVREGNGFFLSLGDRVSIEEFNRNAAPFFKRELRDRKKGFEHKTAGNSSLSTQGITHPAVALMGKVEDPENYVFTDIFLMEPSPDSRAATLLTLSTGEPLLLYLPVGKGHAFLYLSTMDLAWNNFALRPFFLPFVRGIVSFMSGGGRDPIRKSYSVGDTVLLSAGGMAAIDLPSGARRFCLPENDLVCFRETDAPGIYTVKKERAGEEWFSVNLDPAESRPALLESGRLKAVFAGLPCAEVLVRRNMSALVLRPRPLWAFCLFGAMLLAFLESLICGLGTPASGVKKGGEAVHG